MEPRTTSRLQRKEAAFEVKAEGNERFRNGRLRSALECYEEAIRMDPSEPVYYANRSTCLFELGEYAAACEDSKQASLLYREKQKIGMISRSDANSLIEKLLRQSARCFLCMNTRESLEAARSLLNRCIELHPDPDKELLSMHAGAVAAVEEAASASAGEASGPGLLSAGASKGGAGRACDVLPRYRSPVVNGPTPYSCIGWEVALSGLAGRVASPADTEATFSSKGGTFGEDADDNEGAIDLASRPEGERSLSMLFGGLGDARQVLATFRDLHQQAARSKGRLAFPSVALSLLLNDVKAECLARAVVMFRALEALGRALQAAGAVPGGCLAGSGGGAGGMGMGDADMMMGAGDEMGFGPEGADEDPSGDGGRPSNAGADPLALLEASDAVAEAAYRCYHLYLGAFLMPHEADWLQATLDDLTLQQQQQQAQQAQQAPPGPAGGPKPFAFPWLKVGSAHDLAALRSVVERWRVMCKAMEPAVMARIYQSSMQRPAEDEADPAGMGNGSGSAAEEMDAGLSLEQQWREQVREAMMEQIECMADEEVEALAEAEGATAAEKRAYLKEHWSREVDPRTLDLMRHLPSAHREIEFFHTTMILPVPPPEAARRAFAAAPGALLDRSQGRALHRLWRPNVTLVCASTPLEAVAGLSEEELASSSKLTELKFCPFKALKLLLMAPGDEGVLPRQEAFRSAALFFSEVALGLVGLIDAGNLDVELYLGDANDLGNTRPAGTMDRILLSNVPDYTTLLPPMIKLTPLLKQAPGAALKHSVIKFNSVFRDLPEYAHSMGLYVPDMSSLPLYLGINHEYGGLWAHLIEWSRASPQPPPEALDASTGSAFSASGLGDGRTSPKVEVHSLPPAPDQQAWLATVFLSMAMPLYRESAVASTEIRPLTLHAFFELCHHLGQRGLFPPHNVAWVIEHAMRGELRTVAVPPDETPWSPHFTWRRHHYQRALPTGAFALETRTLAGLWQERLGFRLCAPVGQRLPRPEDVIQVRVAIPGLADAEAWLGRTGLGLAKVVGVALLHPEFCATHERALDPKNHTFHSPAPSPAGSSPGRLSSQMQEEYEDFVAEEEDREHRLRMGSSDDLVRAGAAAAGASSASVASLSADGKHRVGATSIGSIRELGAIGGGGLRPLLLDRETQGKGHVHLLSCVRWDSGSGEAALLLDKADLRAFAAEAFHVVLLRTDSWLPLCAPFPLADDPGAACPLPQALQQQHNQQQQQEQGGMMEVEEASPEHVLGQNGTTASAGALGAMGIGTAAAAPAASAVSPREASGSSGHEGGVAPGGVVEEDDGTHAGKMNRTKTY